MTAAFGGLAKMLQDRPENFYEKFANDYLTVTQFRKPLANRELSGYNKIVLVADLC